ncbi:MAG: MmgE/PrpD family protein [Nitrospinae bacterium]|nr:MmgE/PrpD family protein [Nitrospinota bacterium]
MPGNSYFSGHIPHLRGGRQDVARWAAGLRFGDLPHEVVDRARGATLQAIGSALLGSQTEDGRRAVALITEEEAGVRNGATIMVSGAGATKGGAAFANSEMALAGGKWDTFRMLTHPGTSIIPAALAAAEARGASGEEFLTGVAAGYEVMERLASDFIPTVMSRGFHAGPVYFRGRRRRRENYGFGRGANEQRDCALRESRER